VRQIRGVLPVIPTPFSEGEFDADSFGAMLDRMLPSVDGYTLLGSTGEAPSMPVSERKAIVEQAIEMTPSEKAVVVGVTSACIGDAVELAEHAEDRGAAAVLCAAPFYFTNTPDGILGFLREIDSRIGVDLVLYDNPIATKTKLAAQDVVSWAEELEHLRAVKLTDHALDKVPLWHDAGLDVIGGDDPILFRYLAVGVDGVMVIAPVILPVAFAEVWRLMRSDRPEAALEVFSAEILPVLHVLGIGDEIVTTKALLHEIGVFASPEVRLPLMPVDDARRSLLREAFDIASAATESRLSETQPEPA